MTREDLLALPPVVDVVTAAQIVGLGTDAVYDLVKAGTWPTPVLRLGRLIRIPSAPLLDLVGVHPGEATSESAGGHADE